MDQAESLRNIIKKREIDEKKRTARVITVTSGKGGVGKTSFSVNLAIQLHRLGKKWLYWMLTLVWQTLRLCLVFAQSIIWQI